MRVLVFLALGAVAAAVPARGSSDAVVAALASTVDVEARFSGMTSTPVLLPLIVRSSSSWQVSASLVTARTRLTNRSGDAASAVAIRLQGGDGEWKELRPGLGVPVADGEGAADAGVPLTLAVDVEADESVRAGTYVAAIRFSLGPASAAETVSVRYRVPVRVVLTPDERPFEIAPRDPMEGGLFWSEARAYRVVTNAPWKLVARVEAPPQVAGTETRFRADALHIRSGAGDLRMSEASSIVLAEGGPTGSGGHLISVSLGLETPEHLRAGIYTGGLAIWAEVATPFPGATP